MTRPRQSDTDACPGALRLHAAADGLLARVRLPGGVLTGAQLRSLRELAEEFGDGRLELTSRANLQLRALKAEQAETLATRLRAAGLLPSTTHDAVRNIAAPPLADDLLTRLVADLDAAICADPGLAALPGKFLFAIGHVPLAADVAAIPVPPVTVEPGQGAWFALRFGGHDTGLRVSGETVVEALLAGAHAFLAERETQRRVVAHEAGTQRRGDTRHGADAKRGSDSQHEADTRRGADTRRESDAQHEGDTQRGARPQRGGDTRRGADIQRGGDPQRGGDTQRGRGVAAWRLRELTDGPGRVAGRVAEALGITPVSVPAAAPAEGVEPGALVGVVTGNGQFAAGASVPLGRLEGVQARVLEDAERLVVTPWRGVLVPGVAEAAAETWIARMAAVGLVVTATSRWNGVSACAGRPGCAKSLADVRADADAATRFVAGLPVHWVGCGRACGSPAGPHVRVEATGSGYEVTRRSADGEAVTTRDGEAATAGAGTLPDVAADAGTSPHVTADAGALLDVVAGARRA